LAKLKETWSGKMSTILEPGLNSRLRGENEEKTPNSLLFELCYMQVHSFGKLHHCSDVTSKIYKPAFHGSHLSHNTSYGGAATLWVFHLP